MRKILPLAIVGFALPFAATAQVGSGEAIWQGQTSLQEFDAECTFLQNNPGTMVLAGSIWTVTTPATVHLKTRDADHVTVESDDLIRLDSSGDAVDTAVVDYTGSGVTGGPPSITPVVTPTLISVEGISSPGASVFTIAVGGEAVMANTDALGNSTGYHIRHVVTCVQ